MQDHPIGVGGAAVEDEGAEYATVGTNDEADTHVQLILTLQYRVGGEQSFGRTSVATFGQRRGSDTEKFGNVRGDTAPVFFPVARVVPDAQRHSAWELQRTIPER